MSPCQYTALGEFCKELADMGPDNRPGYFRNKYRIRVKITLSRMQVPRGK
jgi:hypothetical protein